MRFIATFLVAAAFACAQDPRAGSIAGRVLDKTTNQPIRKAIVVLDWFGTPRSFATEQTDSDGRFRFSELPAGQYEMRATRPGYGTVAYGAERPRQNGEIFTLSAGEAKTGMDICLAHGGAIAGMVTTADGEPLINADVTVYIEMFARGVRQLMRRGYARANERGEYRVANLEPGEYYVSALSRGVAGEPGSEVFQAQYYRGVTDQNKAAAVTVGAGEVVRGIDFRITSARVIPLHGRVTGVPEHDAKAPLRIDLVPAAPGSRQFGRQGNQAFGPEHRFTFDNVPAGEYMLIASMASGERRYRTVQKFEAGEGPREEVVMGLNEAVDIKGQVRLDGSAPEFSQRVSVELVPGDGLPSPDRLTADAGPDGTFTIRQVPMGVWDINVRPVPRGGYIKSMRLGDQDVLTEEMKVGPATGVPLNIVISARGAQIEGNVQSGPQQHRTAVVLAPWGRFRHVTSFYGFQMTDEKGYFEIRGISPGEYRLFAFDEMKPQGWMETGYLERFEKDAETLHISEGARVTVTPRMIVTAAKEPKR